MIEFTPNVQKGSDPLYIQLYKSIRLEIQKGHLPAHTKLPSQRQLAKHLNVSRNTVDIAYQQLSAEGYVKGVERKGLFVVPLNQDLFFPEQKQGHFPTEETSANVTPTRFNFRYGEVDLEHFPYKQWRKYTLESIHRENRDLFLYGYHQGELGLRKEIAHYIYQSRGVRCLPEQIVVGAGTQYLVDLLCKLIGTKDSYAMEEPGYNRIRETFQHSGVSLSPIPLDDQGIRVDKLYESNANVVYVTPSHQFPTGVLMPLSRRNELLEWAKNVDGYIIEDDYDGEFRYVGLPIPALQGIDHHEHVIYLGTFAKSLTPAARISYAVLPQRLLNHYSENFTHLQQTVSRFHQYTLERFMESGDWWRHLNRTKTRYKSRQQTLLRALKTHMPDLNVSGNDSGLHVIVEPNLPLSEEELIRRAETLGVAVYPTSIYYANEKPVTSQVLLGFAGLSEETIEEGIQTLKKAWYHS
ncbi:PLP-dependent aminotransferase family protein [Geomicrobium sediminis]|uniref:GntR family transcriptional regulator/MocR family aminotransferase n=1 Tax=Geomicrobium sediminis TaxID=1347788 RepID=A0ABS2P9I9_9BACL|nr:PLP-dependent aminotransferase family protein [Geomicrobium sediminis]MBM7632078.1 GntR family transcriptional regulator/MocR family aminotransferase [Geomicrobium sediminis]